MTSTHRADTAVAYALAVMGNYGETPEISREIQTVAELSHWYFSRLAGSTDSAAPSGTPEDPRRARRHSHNCIDDKRLRDGGAAGPAAAGPMHRETMTSRGSHGPYVSSPRPHRPTGIPARVSAG